MQIKMPKYAEKICNMRTLPNMRKMRQSVKYAAIAYSRFSDMPNCSSMQCIKTKSLSHFYRNVTTLHSGLCYCKSVCRL